MLQILYADSESLDSSKNIFSFANRFPLAHAVLGPHDCMQESSQWNCGKDNFITLHVGRWQVHCSQGPQACGRELLLFFPADTGGYCDHSISLHRCRPCSSPLSNTRTAEQREDEAVTAQLGSKQLLL